MTKVTIFLLYLQTFLSVSIRYILRVEDNYSLCFHARTGEQFSSGAGLGTRRTNDATSELDAYSSQRSVLRLDNCFCNLVKMIRMAAESLA